MQTCWPNHILRSFSFPGSILIPSQVILPLKSGSAIWLKTGFASLSKAGSWWEIIWMRWRMSAGAGRLDFLVVILARERLASLISKFPVLGSNKLCAGFIVALGLAWES